MLCFSLKGVFVANKKALLERKEVLDVAHEMLERFEAHLTAQGQFTVQIETLNLKNKNKSRKEQEARDSISCTQWYLKNKIHLFLLK